MLKTGFRAQPISAILLVALTGASIIRGADVDEAHATRTSRPAAVRGNAASPVPRRGCVSVAPAETWEEGLLSGNDTIGANVLSQPLDETIIFTHARMFLPTGDPAPPPDTSRHLPEMRQLIDRGLYDQATRLGFKLSGREDYRSSFGTRGLILPTNTSAHGCNLLPL